MGSIQNAEVFALAGNWAENLWEKKSFSKRIQGNVQNTSGNSERLDGLIQPRSTIQIPKDGRSSAWQEK